MNVGEAWKSSSVSDWMIVLFTLALTITAILQYQLTRDQLRTSQTDLRAWIAFEPRDPSEKIEPDRYQTLREGDPIEYNVRIQNTGKTPAVNVRGHVIVTLVRTGSPTPFALMKDDFRGFRIESGVLIPNKDMKVTAQRTNGHGLEVARAAEILELLEKKARIVVIGRVVYTDVFKKDHWTQFCRPATGYAEPDCAAYNQVDDFE